MTLILPPILTPSSRSTSHQTTASSPSNNDNNFPDAVEPQATPINPFSVDIQSWEEWSLKLCPPPPLPSSLSLSTPPKIDFFCNLPAGGRVLIVAKSPLTFTPLKGGIKLLPDDTENLRTRERTELSGPINLFDSSPYEKSVPMKKTVVEDPMDLAPGKVEGGIWAPKIDDTAFDFDWPSEEIRKACEEFFGEDIESELPALNWIPLESTLDQGVDENEMELHIEH